LKAAGRVHFPHRVITSIVVLAEYLVAEARLLESGSEHSKKDAREQIPHERIKDAPAMARELLWRARLVIYGSASDEESSSGLVGGKRKRSIESQEPDDNPLFKNFKPKKWDSRTEKVLEKQNRVMSISKPGDEQWEEKWSEWRDLVDEGDEDVAQVTHFRDVLIRVRKTARGLERQRIERIVEELTWENDRGDTTS
jgi:F-box/leucine-rich repeat protein 10/11